MASILATSIDLTKIPKDKIIEGKKGKYLPITITLNDEVDQFGNQGPVIISQSKEEREGKVDKIYLGNVQVVWTNGENVEYEVPGIGELANNMWKGKADIINHDEQLVIDLKTTSSIKSFRQSARRFNYDSQAYIYSKLFGYEMVFIVIDKASHVIGIYDCSPDFYERGERKVEEASHIYDLFFNTEGFDPSNYLINETL